ncbi:hypothetical protein [Roseicella sp. DB1501]|uniref:hypothetical protein n=1 Tax=Roseicella sp. DB1501 TaxID=2730925 RepID=UPI0014909A8A|nr:hypothetical protein [Roseicella sp. DB1501]NOG69273.1 hypothetical protein [Roseicella sp. DB1501]
MPTTAADRPNLLAKKPGDIVLLIIGLLALMLGAGQGPTWLTILGVLFLIGGVVVLAMKVSRRNDADLR